MKKSLIIAVVVVLAGVGIFISQRGKDDSPEKSPSGPQVSESSVEGEDLNNFFRAFSGVESYRIRVNSEVSGMEGELVIEYGRNGNVHMVTETEEGSFETVYTAEASYIKNAGTDTWLRMESPGEDWFEEFDYDEERFRQEVEDTSLSLSGEEPCGQMNCLVYTYTEDQTPVKMYIDDQDHLIRRMEITQEGEKSTLTFEYASFEVEVPENVQNLPSPGSQNLPY